MTRSPTQLPRRWLILCAVILVLCAALAGVGLSLAFRQTDAVVRLQSDALRAKARQLAESIQSDLRLRAGQALAAAGAAYERQPPWRPQSLPGVPPWMTDWFVSTRDEVRVEPPAPPRVEPDPPIETAPIWYLEAQQLEFQEARIELAAQSYERCTGPATPSFWQRRAWMAVARCKRKLGQLQQAVAIYDRLLKEKTPERERFDVALAGVDTLLGVSSDTPPSDAARLSVEKMVEDIVAGRTILDDEAQVELLMVRLARTGARTGADPSGLRERLRTQLSQQKQRSRFRDLVADLLRVRYGGTGSADRAGEVLFLQDALAPSPVFIAYQRQRLAGGRDVLIGGSIDLAAVRNALVEPALSGTGRHELLLLTDASSQRETSDWSEPLLPLLPSWRLSASPQFTEDLRRTALAQRALFGGLTLLASLALLATVLLSLRAVRRELHLAQMRSEFAAGVSHELKTPLALIRMFGETLREGRVSSEARKQEYYEIIARESERLTRLIDNILDFSRIQSGRKQYAMEPCDVGEVVRQAVASFAPQLEQQQVKYDVTAAPDLPTIKVDAEAMSQAVLNLIENAVKYSPTEKSIRVAVSALPQSRGVSIEVSDRGIGISTADIPRLFEPFFRADDPRVRQTRGSGLGLTLVQHVVHGHGGRIHVHSNPGEGSTFRIELPAASS